MVLTKSVFRRLTTVLVFLMLLDIVTTMNCVEKTGSWAGELNPIILFSISKIGVMGTHITKLCFMVAIWFAIPEVAIRYPDHLHYTFYLLVALNFVYLFAVVVALCSCVPL